MPHTRALRAHMIQSYDGTEWQIFVAVPDEPRWPHVPFPLGRHPDPERPRRRPRRSRLRPARRGTAWEWMETVFEGLPDGDVSLVATTTVAPDKPTDTRPALLTRPEQRPTGQGNPLPRPPDSIKGTGGHPSMPHRTPANRPRRRKPERPLPRGTRA